MVLLDTNILIYLRDPVKGKLIASQLSDQVLATSNVIITEVLGFKGFLPGEAKFFEDLFEAMRNYPFDDTVTKQVITLRRTTNLQLPDAIIAATAMVNNLTLWTHNIDDFKSITDLKLFDPIVD